MSRRRRTPEEENEILDNIEAVANDLAKQVGTLQTFLRELKASRRPEALEVIGKTLKEIGETALGQQPGERRSYG